MVTPPVDDFNIVVMYFAESLFTKKALGLANCSSNRRHFGGVKSAPTAVSAAIGHEKSWNLGLA
jgi:hypothetical protein